MRPLPLCGERNWFFYSCTCLNTCACGSKVFRAAISDGGLLVTQFAVGNCVRVDRVVRFDLSPFELGEKPTGVSCCALDEDVFVLVFGKSHTVFGCAILSVWQETCGIMPQEPTITYLSTPFDLPNYDDDVSLLQFSPASVLFAPLAYSTWALLDISEGEVDIRLLQLPPTLGRVRYCPPVVRRPGYVVALAIYTGRNDQIGSRAARTSLDSAFSDDHDEVFPPILEAFGNRASVGDPLHLEVQRRKRALVRICARQGEIVFRRRLALPGHGAYDCSSLILYRRFLILMGGDRDCPGGFASLNAGISIFDLKRKRFSEIDTRGLPYRGDRFSALFSGRQGFYSIGGEVNAESFFTPYTYLCHWIVHKRLRRSFRKLISREQCRQIPPRQRKHASALTKMLMRRVRRKMKLQSRARSGQRARVKTVEAGKDAEKAMAIRTTKAAGALRMMRIAQLAGTPLVMGLSKPAEPAGANELSKAGKTSEASDETRATEASNASETSGTSETSEFSETTDTTESTDSTDMSGSTEANDSGETPGAFPEFLESETSSTFSESSEDSEEIPKIPIFACIQAGIIARLMHLDVRESGKQGSLERAESSQPSAAARSAGSTRIFMATQGSVMAGSRPLLFLKSENAENRISSDGTAAARNVASHSVRFSKETKSSGCTKATKSTEVLDSSRAGSELCDSRATETSHSEAGVGEKTRLSAKEQEGKDAKLKSAASEAMAASPSDWRHHEQPAKPFGRSVDEEKVHNGITDKPSLANGSHASCKSSKAISDSSPAEEGAPICSGEGGAKAEADRADEAGVPEHSERSVPSTKTATVDDSGVPIALISNAETDKIVKGETGSAAGSAAAEVMPCATAGIIESSLTPAAGGSEATEMPALPANVTAEATRASQTAE